MVKQTRCISNKTFFSLSDSTKMRMHNQQFYITLDEWKEIFKWIENNFSNPYFIEIERGPDKEIVNRWILIYGKEDAVAFKLRWS